MAAPPRRPQPRSLHGSTPLAPTSWAMGSASSQATAGLSPMISWRLRGRQTKGCEGRTGGQGGWVRMPRQRAPAPTQAAARSNHACPAGQQQPASRPASQPPAQQRLRGVLLIGQQAVADAQQAHDRALHQRVGVRGCAGGVGQAGSRHAWVRTSAGGGGGSGSQALLPIGLHCAASVQRRASPLSAAVQAARNSWSRGQMSPTRSRLRSASATSSSRQSSAGAVPSPLRAAPATLPADHITALTSSTSDSAVCQWVRTCKRMRSGRGHKS